MTTDELDSFLNIIQKISSNIISNPTETKYQKLKFSNRLVAEKINARSGGEDFMLTMGFDVIEEDGEKAYMLRPDGLESMQSSVGWLR